MVVAADGLHSVAPKKERCRLGEKTALSDTVLMTLSSRVAVDRVVAAAAGACHTLVVTTDGFLFSFGAGGDGQLALAISKTVQLRSSYMYPSTVLLV